MTRTFRHSVGWLIERVRRARGRATSHDQLLAHTRQLQHQATALEMQALELQTALRAHKRSEERYRLLFNATQDGVLLHGPDARIVAANESALRILGLAESQILGRTAMDPRWRVIREDGTSFPPDELPASVAIRTGEPQRDVVLGVERPNGERRWVVASATPMDDPAQGGAIVVVSFTDITELLSSRHLLRDTEAQLLHAQKMEAVGQLAGGIAHDFNNLLTVITAFTELLALEIPRDSPRRSDLNEITKAAMRAADLTRQLLAFSRKQVLRPRELNLNDTVENMSRMLARLIGEDIEVITRLAPDLEIISADPGQLEQVIANLAVNARDAMPDGGVLLIETANVTLAKPHMTGGEVAVPTGDYVMLCVSDTGVGMDTSVRDRIFEPFFTTKEPGKGTGLGLSTVYGIVKQTGGHVWVDSVPGAGTRFHLFFPKRDIEPSEEPLTVSNEHAIPKDGALVLLVEDEEAVRVAIRRMLQRAGFRVLEATNGRDALEIAAGKTGEIDLLLTDLVMPGMSGVELAREVNATDAHMRVLLMSGYSEASTRQGSLPPNAALLEKPFSASALSRKVREVLGR